MPYFIKHPKGFAFYGSSTELLKDFPEIRYQSLKRSMEFGRIHLQGDLKVYKGQIIKQKIKRKKSN